MDYLSLLKSLERAYSKVVYRGKLLVVIETEL